MSKTIQKTETELINVDNPLMLIQAEVKVPKGNFNSFGKYKYRTAEDILEVAKPVAHKYGFSIVLSDEIVQVGDRIYVKATATMSNGKLNYTAIGFAREEEVKKGMDASQITGSASSYARKYALQGLLALDSEKDADATNTHESDTRVDMNDALMNKLVDRYNKGEKDVFEKANTYYIFREKDLQTIKTLKNGK